MKISVLILGVVLAFPLAGAIVPQEITHHIRVYEFGFEDSQSGEAYTVVHAGTRVIWDFVVQNQFPLRVASQSSLSQGGLNSPWFDSGVIPGKSNYAFGVTFTTPAVVKYGDPAHQPGMSGVLVVIP